MSDDAAASSAPELKAGHPPAVKAGGMRVVQHKKEPEKSETSAVMTAEEEEEFGASNSKADPHHQSVMVSGAVGKGDKDFTEQAVKNFHQKPLPHLDERPRPTQQNYMLHQPRKLQ